MIEEELHKQLVNLVGEVLELPGTEVVDEMTVGETEGWDSLAHVNLLVAVEEFFGIVFSSKEMGALKSVGEIRSKVVEKLRA